MAGMPEPAMPASPREIDVDLATERVLFHVRRYRGEEAPDAKIAFGAFPIENLAKDPIFEAADMTAITRRSVLRMAERVHEIWADERRVGLHIVLSDGPGGDHRHLALAKAKILKPCRALSVFEGGGYRVDMDRARERAVIRLLEILGIPELPEPPNPDDEASLGDLAP
ncbi:hypothetical protein [Methylobacterium sp. 37f]|uniref:hypothetical protein n=1 Tax=Methylobacterium sp. 37f TaxID=2817058 RepID=UPI001FFCDA88|nr:hypothetical protein [Methylobacterium sp. 37f]MCK2054973.1 hypothetical protein [Methylobacterium sp. 37f]